MSIRIDSIDSFPRDVDTIDMFIHRALLDLLASETHEVARMADERRRDRVLTRDGGEYADVAHRP
jgi:hypothetical protein